MSRLIALSRWISTLTYAHVRSVESLQPAKLANGRRFNGVRLADDGLTLGRDRRLYAILDGVARVMPLHLVAERYDPKELRKAYQAARRKARARRRAARQQRAA